MFIVDPAIVFIRKRQQTGLQQSEKIKIKYYISTDLSMFLRISFLVLKARVTQGLMVSFLVLKASDPGLNGFQVYAFVGWASKMGNRPVPTLRLRRNTNTQKMLTNMHALSGIQDHSPRVWFIRGPVRITRRVSASFTVAEAVNLLSWYSDH